MATDTDNHAKEQAEAQLNSIRHLVGMLDSDPEEALQRIHEDPLSVQVRSSDWHDPGADGTAPDEYMLLLCTGGPAVRVVGELNQYNEPTTATVQFQDWFEEWSDLDITPEEEDDVIRYALQFWFGEW
jgi:hypothetical protein